MQNINAVTRLKMIIDAVKNGYIEEYNSEIIENIDIYVTKTFVATRVYGNDGHIIMSSHCDICENLDVFVAQSTGHVIITSTNGLTSLKPSLLELLV